ncbi:MAG: DUF2087 domain-containing protein [Clostridiales bacterium]|nr:DUF2087 domain-containing protein [Clostridiales bacterium]
MEETAQKIKNFLDADKRLVSYPAKRKSRMWALRYLAEKMEPERIYTEKELAELLNGWHTFGDPATLRRELYDYRFIGRDLSGRGYWLEREQPSPEEWE